MPGAGEWGCAGGYREGLAQWGWGSGAEGALEGTRKGVMRERSHEMGV